jgi:transcriptional regulator with XRE-family HTH domain
MASELGKMIRETRLALGIGLREFAGEIGKSPGFVTQLECEDDVPSVAEETLRVIASRLRLNLDELLVLANRTPSDVIPESPLEVALYRTVKGLSASEQRRVKKYLDGLVRKRPEG